MENKKDYKLLIVIGLLLGYFILAPFVEFAINYYSDAEYQYSDE